jgi:hypothetical protein
MAAKKKAAKKAAPKAKKEGPTIQSVAEESIKGGASNEDALAAVRKKFPDCKTDMASINWYRHNLRAVDKSVKTAREIRKAARAAEEKKTKAKAKA